MSFESPGAAAPDETQCQYGASKLTCRGPERPLDAPYYAFLGDGETYGRFVNRPFPALVERTTGVICVNLGCVNAGLDAVLGDGDFVTIATGARIAVVQAMGAQNLSNRFYRVHPRRNDRFLEPTEVLTGLYPEIDFTEFHFNRHLLKALRRTSPRRFEAVSAELKTVWIERMRGLLVRFARKPLLLWLRYEGAGHEGGGIAGNPALVDGEMVAQLRDVLAGVIRVPVCAAGAAGELDGMVFGAMQEPAAAHLIGPEAHGRIARALVRALPVSE